MPRSDKGIPRPGTRPDARAEIGTTKLCRRCAEEKPIDDFPLTTTRSRDGSYSWTYPRPNCHACQKIIAAEKYQRHRAHYAAKGMEWYDANLERVDFYHAQGRAKRVGATEFMSLDEWRDLRSGTHCHWCAIDLHPGFTNIDHVRPLAWGGQHTRDNVVLACANCNQRRAWEQKATRRKESR